MGAVAGTVASVNPDGRVYRSDPLQVSIQAHPPPQSPLPPCERNDKAAGLRGAVLISSLANGRAEDKLPVNSPPESELVAFARANVPRLTHFAAEVADQRLRDEKAVPRCTGEGIEDGKAVLCLEYLG